MKLIFFLISFVILACQSKPTRPQAQKAIVVLKPTKGNKVKGFLKFTQMGTQVEVIAQVEGLNPGAQHGFHIHEFGDLSNNDGTSCGGHYNPKKTPTRLASREKSPCGVFWQPYSK